MFYYPDSVFDLEHLDPLGHLLDRAKLKEVISFAKANESKMDRDIGRALAGGHFSEPLPEGEIIGPTEPREDPSGIIIYESKFYLSGGR